MRRVFRSVRLPVLLLCFAALALSGGAGAQQPSKDLKELKETSTAFWKAGDLASAIETYRKLLGGVSAAKAAPETNLADAADLSRLYGSMAVLHRRVGKEDLASDLDARRLKLWQQWDRKLPNNPFVIAQLGAVRVEGEPSGSATLRDPHRQGAAR